MIKTANLKMIPCELEHLAAILEGQNRLEQMLDGATVYDNWFDFEGVAGIEAIQYSYDYIKANPDAIGWWMYLFIHSADNALVGFGGFKGTPDESGMVEIGYAIIQDYQSRGLATEAAQGLIDHAFSHALITRVDAHTLPEPNASTRVLEKTGMKNLGTVNVPDDGDVWHWSLDRKNYRNT